MDLNKVIIWHLKNVQMERSEEAKEFKETVAVIFFISSLGGAWGYILYLFMR